MALDKTDWKKTAFACHVGMFQFRVLPFGLANAPDIFQQLMLTVLSEMEAFAMVYVDDILMFAETSEEHFNHIQPVLDRLRQHGLQLKLLKCQFLREESRYMFFVRDKG